MAKKAAPETVSHRPLFKWFEADRKNRARLRAAGYTDGRITNWKGRGIPRAEVAEVARFMGLTYEQYLAKAGHPTTPAVQQPSATYSALSDEALEIAMAFDRMGPQTKERVREHVFLYSIIDRSFPWLRSGKPVSDNYRTFEKWHEENMATSLALEAARISKLRTEK